MSFKIKNDKVKGDSDTHRKYTYVYVTSTLIFVFKLSFKAIATYMHYTFMAPIIYFNEERSVKT